MAALDYPPGLGLPADPRYTMVAQRGRVWFAWLSFVVCMLLAFWVARRIFRVPSLAGAGGGLLIAAVSMNGLAVMVRRATVEFYGDAIGWGWSWFRFRMPIAKMKSVRVYSDALTIKNEWGGLWFLSSRDWRGIHSLGEALGEQGATLDHADGTPSLREHLSGYGVALDIAQGLATIVLFAFGAMLVSRAPFL